MKEAFDTNWVVPMGPNVNAFDKDLEAFVNSKSDGSEPLDRNMACLSAGTAAVHLALIGWGVKAVWCRALLSVLLHIRLHRDCREMFK